MALTVDPFADLKVRQREMWASFAPTAAYTTPVAAHLVEFAEIKPGETVLDVGTGTGVVAITAARMGASVTGLDLTPALLDAARENAQIASLGAIHWVEGDAENLPFADGQFDVVISQFGHMFAPRPDVTIGQMRRVLKTGGRIAFATWPPEHFAGRLFAFVGKNSPPPTRRCATSAMGKSGHCRRAPWRSLRGPILFARRNAISGSKSRALPRVHGALRRPHAETG